MHFLLLIRGRVVVAVSLARRFRLNRLCVMLVPLLGSGSAAGSPPSCKYREHFQRKVTRRHPNQKPVPPQLALFQCEEQRLYSELPPMVVEDHVGRLYP